MLLPVPGLACVPVCHSSYQQAQALHVSILTVTFGHLQLVREDFDDGGLGIGVEVVVVDELNPHRDALGDLERAAFKGRGTTLRSP